MKYKGKKYKRVVLPLGACANDCDLYKECDTSLEKRCMQKDERKYNFGQYKEKKT